MAKFFGPIGYAETVETKPGVWTEQITERNYSGEVLKNTSQWSTSSNSTNDDLNVNIRISIVADPFAYQNFQSIKYIEYMGAKWKIKSVDPQHPRLILEIGGLYNGK